MADKSMYSKYLNKEISLKEYRNWWAQQKGYKNYDGYNVQKGYKQKHYQNNKEKIIKKAKQYRNTHKVKYVGIKRQYYKINKEYISKRNKQYWKTPNGKISRKKSRDKRKREFGYNVINKEDINTPNYVGHHLDKINVLYIPEELHTSIYHRQSDEESMQKINVVAILWYMKK